MKKYKWDLNELRINREILKHAYNGLNDEISKESVLSFIELYNEMIGICTKTNMESMCDNLKDTSIINLLRNAGQFYTFDNLDMIESIISSFETMRDNYWDNVYDPVNIIASNDEIVDVTKNFFKTMTPKDVNDKFNEVLDNDNFLNIMYSKDSYNYAGMTYFDCTLRKKYVNVIRSNTLIDLSILPHEMFHYLFNDYNTYYTLDHQSNYLTEVEGGFANILFSEYFMNTATENNDYFKRYYINSFQDQVEELTIRNMLFDSIKKNNGIRMNKLNKFMNYFKMLPFDNENEIIDYLVIPQDVNIKYSLSYLAAIDLFYIYKDDPDFAFYLLKNIRYHVSEDDIMTLLRRNHITFMDDNYTNLKKYLKK